MRSSQLIIGENIFEQLIDLMKKLRLTIWVLVFLNDINAYSEMLNDFGPECQRECPFTLTVKRID